jgi:hypothetical protein
MRPTQHAMDNSMRKNDSDQPNDDDRFKPAHFLVYYLQRLFIWGEWSIGNAKKKTRNQPGLPHATRPLSTCSQPETSGRMKRPQAGFIDTILHTSLSWSSSTSAAQPVHTRLACQDGRYVYG